MLSLSSQNIKTIVKVFWGGLPGPFGRSFAGIDHMPSTDEQGKTVLKVIGSGSDSLALQLENAMVNHYSRGHKNLKTKLYHLADGDKEGDSPGLTGTSSKRAKCGGRLRDNYSCHLWQPEQLPEEETADSQDFKKSG